MNESSEHSCNMFTSTNHIYLLILNQNSYMYKTPQK